MPSITQCLSQPSSCLPTLTTQNLFVVGGTTLAAVVGGYLLLRTDVCGKCLRGRTAALPIPPPPHYAPQAALDTIRVARREGEFMLGSDGSLLHERQLNEYRAYESLIQHVGNGLFIEESFTLLNGMEPEEFHKLDLSICLRIDLLTSLIRANHERARDLRILLLSHCEEYMAELGVKLGVITTRFERFLPGRYPLPGEAPPVSLETRKRSLDALRMAIPQAR